MAENLDEKPIGEEFLRMFKEAKRDDDLAQKGLHMELPAARRRIQEQDALLNAIRNEVPNSPPSQNLILAVRSAIGDRDLRIYNLEQAYYTLLNAVATKHPGESRHETALRYIRERESGNAKGAARIKSEGNHAD